MSNTVINSAGILVFDSATQAEILGASEFSDFENFFGSNSAESCNASEVNVDRSLLPSFNVNALETIATETFYGRMSALETLEKINSDEYLPLIDLLIEEALPGKWTRCDKLTKEITFHDDIHSEEAAIIFDTETFVKYGNYPIIGQALSSSAMWLYLDVSFDGITEYCPSFISIGQGQRVIVAQNSAFDACRITERYDFNNHLEFVDTMSLTNCLAGLDSGSRWAITIPHGVNGAADSIKRLGCGKSLVEAYNFFCTDREPLSKADKSARNIFVEATDFQEFVDNQYELLKYSLLDVVYTLRLLQAQLPLMRAWAGDAYYAILLGHSTVGNALLPVQPDREDWIDLCEELTEDSFIKINSLVFDYFSELHSDFQSNRISPELIKVEWKLHKPKGWRKKQLPEGWPIMSKWYYDFLSNNLGVTTHAFGNLLQLEFFADGQWRPLKQSQQLGWHYSNKSGDLTRTPHISGVPETNVGSLISSDSLRFFDDYEEPILRSKTLDYNNELLKEILELADNCSIWKGFSGRIKSQFVL